jgi:hypothetical protein
MRLLLYFALAAASAAFARADDDRPRSPGEPRVQEPDRSPRQDRSRLMLPDERPDPIRPSIERALAYLATQQAVMPDGSFPARLGKDHSPIGVTALGALAYMAGGSTPTRGPYAKDLTRALHYLLDHQAAAGEQYEGYVHAPEDQQSQTHGHGLATLALAQAYCVSPGSRLGRELGPALELAVRRIEKSQGLEGGWHYYPYRSTEHEGSVTVCLVQALRAARNIGVRVEPKVIEKAVAYVKKLQTESGGFRYSFSQPETSVALTAACLATLHSTGVYEGSEIDEGYDYVWRELAIREEDEARGDWTSQAIFPFYERFYLSQALWQHRDPEIFKRWAAKETQRVLTSQSPDGSWPDERSDGRERRGPGRFGACYATSMNVLYLSVPEGILPIFRR